MENLFKIKERIASLRGKSEESKYSIFLLLCIVEESECWKVKKSYEGMNLTKEEIEKYRKSSFAYIVQDFFDESYVIFKNRKATKEKIEQAGMDAKELFIHYGYDNCIAWRDMTVDEVNEMIPVIESYIVKSSLKRVPSFTEVRKRIWPNKYKSAVIKVTDTIAYLKSKLTDREIRIQELEKELKSAYARIEQLEKQLDKLMVVG